MAAKQTDNSLTLFNTRHLLLSSSSGQWAGAQSPPPAAATGQGRQEETHPAHVQRTADLRAGEDLRADQVLGRTRTSEISLRLRDERVPSQSEWKRKRTI